jgi:DNA-binding protein H-NS
MTPEIEALSFDQLRTLYREIGALIAERRHHELEQIRQRVALLGFTTVDLDPPKQKRGGAGTARYRDPDNPSHTYSGKGKYPTWLAEKLDAGHTIDEFRAS